MSLFEQYRNSKQLWIVTALLVALALCIGVLVYLLSAQPAGPVQPEEPSSAVSSPEPSSSSEEESSEPEEEISSEEASSSSKTQAYQPAPAPVPRPTKPVVPPQTSYTINSPGIYDKTETYSSVVIHSGNVALKNATVNGDLLISDKASGEITLQNVVVKGKIVMDAGERLRLYSVTAPELVVQCASGQTALELYDRSTVQVLSQKSHLTIDESGLSEGYDGVKKVNISEGNRLWQNLTLLDGELESVTVGFRANVKVEPAGEIGSLYANASAHLAGDGYVDKLYVAHDDVTYEREPGSINVKDGYQDPCESSYGVNETEPSDSGGGDSSYALSAPTGLKVSDGGSYRTVALSFDPVRNARGYLVAPYIAKKDGSYQALGGISLLSSQTSTPFYHGEIGNEGTRIYFTVYAKGNGGSIRDSRPAQSDTFSVVKLSTPSALSISGGSGKALRFSFTGVTGSEGYRLTPVIDGIAQTAEATDLAHGVTSYLYTPADPSKKISFKVVAKGNGTLTLDSDEISSLPHASIKLAPPENLKIGTAPSTSKNQLLFSFDAAPNAAGYELTPYVGSEKQTAVSLTKEQTSYLFTYSRDFAAGDVISFTVRSKGDGFNYLDSDLSAKSPEFTISAVLPPTNLTISNPTARNHAGDSGRALLGFTGSQNAAGYLLTPYLNGIAQTPVELDRGQTSHTFSNDLLLSKGTTLSFSVYAKSGSIFVPDSPAAKSEELTVQKLDAPDGLSISYSGGVLNGSWNRVAGAGQYEVIPILDGAFSPSVAASAPNSTLSSDTGFHTIAFQVRAVSNAALTLDSDYAVSYTVTKAALGDAPPALAVEAVPGSVTITTGPLPENASGYRLVLTNGNKTLTRTFTGTGITVGATDSFPIKPGDGISVTLCAYAEEAVVKSGEEYRLPLGTSGEAAQTVTVTVPVKAVASLGAFSAPARDRLEFALTPLSDLPSGATSLLLRFETLSGDSQIGEQVQVLNGSSAPLQSAPFDGFDSVKVILTAVDGSGMALCSYESTAVVASFAPPPDPSSSTESPSSAI